MKYKYTSFFPPDETLKWVKKPMVAVEVFGISGAQTFNALVDSGADCSLFNINIAQALGIDLAGCKQVKMRGISGGVAGYRLEDVGIKLEGVNKIIKIPVCFADSSSVGVLLGQEGFFDQNRIKFEKDHDTFEINPVNK